MERLPEETDRAICQGKTRVCQEGNLTVEEYTYGITRREPSHMDT